jgi:hypothetical protein
MSLPNRPTVKAAGTLIETPHCHHVAVAQISLQTKPNIAPRIKYVTTTGTTRSALKVPGPSANTAAPATNDAGTPTSTAMMCASVLGVLLNTRLRIVAVRQSPSHKRDPTTACDVGHNITASLVLIARGAA